jgi:hypothetical protein
LRQLAGNTGKMTWVGDLPMPATAVLHLSADAIESLTAERDRLKAALWRASRLQELDLAGQYAVTISDAIRALATQENTQAASDNA